MFSAKISIKSLSGCAIIFLFAVLFLLLPPLNADAEDSKKPLRILFLGDSLTAGYGLDEQKAYPALVEKIARGEGFPIEAKNAGISGDTTASGLRRINWLLKGQSYDLLFLALGANDGLRGLSPEHTKQNLKAIISAAREKSPKITILLAGMIMPPNMGQHYTSEFKKIFIELAREENTTFMPFLLKDVAGRKDLNLPDGIHPNTKGQTIVAKNVWGMIKPLLTSDSIPIANQFSFF